MKPWMKTGALVVLAMFFAQSTLEAQIFKRLGRATKLVRAVADSECAVMVGNSFIFEAAPTQLSVQIFTGKTPANPGLLARFDDSDLLSLAASGNPGDVLILSGKRETIVRDGLRMIKPRNFSADGWSIQPTVKSAAKCGISQRLRDGFQNREFFNLHSDLIASALLMKDPHVAGAYFSGRTNSARDVLGLVRQVELTLSDVLDEPNTADLVALEIAKQAKPVSIVPKGCDLANLRRLAGRMVELTSEHVSDADKSQHAGLLVQADLVADAAERCFP